MQYIDYCITVFIIYGTRIGDGILIFRFNIWCMLEDYKYLVIGNQPYLGLRWFTDSSLLGFKKGN